MKNYFKIGLRNLFKRKGYSFLNILGLTTGMTCCLLIFHYVSYERSYDKAIEGSGNIYRIHRIDIQWWVFLLAGSTALVLAGITIFLQDFKAVIENPIKSLRSE